MDYKVYCKCWGCGGFFELGTGGRTRKVPRKWCNDLCRKTNGRTRSVPRTKEFYPETTPLVKQQCSKCDKWFEGGKFKLIWTGTPGTRFRYDLCDSCLFDIQHREVKRLALQELFDAEGGLCYLCGDETVLLKLDTKDPKAATRDHIIPRNAGGVDHPFNIRLAHRWCNTRKNAYSSGWNTRMAIRSGVLVPPWRSEREGQ